MGYRGHTYDSVTFDDEIILIWKLSEGFDEYGNAKPKPPERRRAVLANVRYASRSERTEAANKGYEAEYTFTISKYEYEDEQEVEFKGKRLEILSVFLLDLETVELTVGERVGR